MVWLAALHRAVAEGQQLSSSEQELHRRRAGEPSSIAAIRYAELLVDLEIRIARLTGKAAAEEQAAIREELALRRKEAVDTFRAACHARTSPASKGSIEEPLETRVIREVAPHTFDKAFTKALRRRGIRVDRREPPTSDLWLWLQRQDKRPVELPAEVTRLRKLDRGDFTREAVADVNRWECDQSMAHPAMAEQWADCTETIVAELVRTRQSLEADLPDVRGEYDLRRLRRAGEAYARGSARCLEAQLMVADLHAQASRIYRALGVTKARVAAAVEAQIAVREYDPTLARQVDRAIDEHRKICSKDLPGERHVGCASALARTVRSRLQPVDLPGNAQREEREFKDRNDAAEGNHEQASGDSKPAAHREVNQLNTFTCPELREQVPKDVARVVGVVDISYSDVGRFGFAWVTEHGEVGTGVDRAVNIHDAWLHALCRTVLDLGGELSSVHVVCRDERAASVLRFVLHKRLVPAELGFAVSERTRDLLRSRVPRIGRVFVSVDTCPQPHRGSAAARRLGVAALRSARESRGAQMVKLLADQISDELRELAESESAPSPPLRTVAQRVSDTTDAGEIRWTTAVGRAQIAGKWCPLPDGLTTPPADRERLRMRIDHRDLAGRAATESNVEARCLGGRWELHGVGWPNDLLPGTLVLLRWRSREELVLATTDPLPRSQRIDDLTYRHRYDIRMVVRENAPGADQEGGTLDLSDTGWVLRTLRKLGHLSSDGSVILAEAALVSNCLELGLPSHRTSGIPPAVRDLIRDRRISRVRGSLDKNGLPSYPPRAGQRRVGLLRFAPKVVDLAAVPNQRQEAPVSRRDHWVDGFVRRLPAGAKASPERIEDHREAMRAAKVVDHPLPDGFTYVRRHRRRTR
ncbi:hypothetical protein [Micromonospora lutea]|uniref:hypothetical protein n=1 Tax=Micromonospora lutea TaxID=419825 RepID=UPI00194FC10C|nr:hypothetical protein [Micromonospora lutea]